MANIILKNGVGQPIEYSGVETIEIPEADATIAPETEFRGFAYDDEFGLYILAVEPSPITFELGEIYRVYWDGTIHLCQAQDLSAMTEGAIGVGNLADFGGTGNGEPFIMVALGGATMCATTDEGESHTVAINKKGGTQIFSAGVATSVTTELNFTDVVEKEIYPEQNLEGFAFSEIWGAHTVVTDAHFDLVLGEKYKVYWDGEWWECETQDAGAVMEGALMLGNGSNFGLSGNNEPFAIGWLGVGITFLSVGSEAPSHTVAVNQFVAGMNITRASEGELISSVAIPKPDTLIPENIAKDVNVAGIVGTHEGGGGGSSDDVRYVTFMNGGVELYVKPVATGDDCVDVLAKGFIETPTKESTAQTDYTYSGWSLTNGGAASNVLGAVTENRTVYAAYTESVRRYTISYYDGDTLLKTESLPYGTIPSYAPAKEGYTFTGWTPAVEPVTCDASYTAIWIEKYDFASLTWDQISEISESGEADKA
ncbi:MAG: hypothetical protein J6S71_00495, partial [Clostridia bacterium]|nr:hypothetical protein [Clostridia bacterium]